MARPQSLWACLLVGFGFWSIPAWAHDPIFGLGPHVLYKGGVEIAAEASAGKAGSAGEQEAMLELTYGLTGDWSAGVDLPWVRKENAGQATSGAGDLTLFTKYRFWRRDSLGLQESAALALKLVTDMADANSVPPLGKGATDAIVGLAYGYESRRQYRWASVRYRVNGEGAGGLERGDRLLIDFVGGIRLRLTSYLEPDTVWLLELNGEYAWRSRLGGVDLADSGGNQWFLSPGIFWTLRNFAVKAGVQVPVYSALNGDQARADYRARLTLEWHL